MGVAVGMTDSTATVADVFNGPGIARSGVLSPALMNAVSNGAASESATVTSPGSTLVSVNSIKVPWSVTGPFGMGQPAPVPTSISSTISSTFQTHAPKYIPRHWALVISTVSA